MNEIKSVTLSGSGVQARARMACDNRCMTVRAPAEHTDYGGGTLRTVEDEKGRRFEVDITFYPSACQLRALARWATETADELEGMNKAQIEKQDKQITVYRGHTPAAGKTHRVALECVKAALDGKNVLCLIDQKHRIKYSVQPVCEWANQELGASDYINDFSNNAIRYSNGAIIKFKSWSEEGIKTDSDSDTLYDLYWVEDCERFPYADKMLDSSARCIMTGRMYSNAPSWLDSIKSSDKVEVIDMNYKDNKFLSEEDIIRISKIWGM